jgi:hypothetical protein
VSAPLAGGVLSAGFAPTILFGPSPQSMSNHPIPLFYFGWCVILWSTMPNPNCNCPHCNKPYREHRSIPGLCGDVNKLKKAMHDVIKKVQCAGWHPSGHSRVMIFRPELDAMEASLEPTPPTSSPAGRRPEPITPEQQKLITEHYEKHGTAFGGRLAKLCGVPQSRGQRWLQWEDRKQK